MSGFRCQAVQQSDQKCCNRCGYVWDMNDDDPPECLTDEDLAKRSGEAAIKNIKEKLNDKT